MAEEEKDAKPPKKPIGLILGVALLAMGAGAGASFFLVNKIGVQELEAGAEEGGEATPEEGASDVASDFQERLLVLDPIVVNITGDGYSRLLKLTVQIECESTAVRDEAEIRIPQIRDGIVSLASSKRLADVTDFEGKALLKEELRDRVSQLLTTGNVRSVLFTDFVVQ